MTASNILEIRDYILARVQVMECGHGTPCWVWRRRCLTCHEAWWAAKREVYKEERRVRAMQRRAA